MCSKDEIIIFLSRQNERQLTDGCLARGLACAFLEYNHGCHSNDCLIMICSKDNYRRYKNGQIENIKCLRSLCSDVKLFVRANLDTAKLSITSTQILKFWFRVFKIKKREFKFGITFLGFRCGELLCSSLFALPLQDPQNMFFSGQFDQKTKFIAKWMLFVFSIRGALVTLQYDNNC